MYCEYLWWETCADGSVVFFTADTDPNYRYDPGWDWAPCGCGSWHVYGCSMCASPPLLRHDKVMLANLDDEMDKIAARNKTIVAEVKCQKHEAEQAADLEETAALYAANPLQRAADEAILQADEDRRQEELQLLANTDALVQEINSEDARHMRAQRRAKAHTVVTMASGDVCTFRIPEVELGLQRAPEIASDEEGAEDDEHRTGDALLDAEIDSGNVAVDEGESVYFDDEDGDSAPIAEDAPEYAALHFEQTEDEIEKDRTQLLQKYYTMHYRLKRAVSAAPSAGCVCAMPDLMRRMRQQDEAKLDKLLKLVKETVTPDPWADQFKAIYAPIQMMQGAVPVSVRVQSRLGGSTHLSQPVNHHR